MTMKTNGHASSQAVLIAPAAAVSTTMMAILLWMLLTTATEGFVEHLLSPKRTSFFSRTSFELHAKQPHQKKRRFSQTVHPGTAEQDGGSGSGTVRFQRHNQQSRRTTTAVEDPVLVAAPKNRTPLDGWGKTSQSSSQSSRYTKRSPPSSSSSSSRIQRTSSVVLSYQYDDDDDPNTSIEALEARLAQKFGTTDVTASRHDDDDDEKANFRGNPVMDPWALEEQVARQSARNFGATASSSSSSSSPLAAFGNQQQPLGVADMVMEYDDDISMDENEEVEGDAWMKDLHMEIETTEQQIKAVKYEENDVSPLSAFGLTPRPQQQQQQQQQATPVDTQQATTPSAPIPIWHNGVPLELTLPFAQQLYDEALAADDTSTDADDDDEFEDAKDEATIASSSSSSSSSSWPDLGITHPQLLTNLQAMGCAIPLAVQRNACPAILNRENDVVVGTYTGSGKTLAFLVPAVQHLLSSSSCDQQSTTTTGPRLLVLAPGRELASQIIAVARDIVANTGLTVQFAIGGTTFAKNVANIRKGKPDILIGTPGRMAELVVGGGDTKRGRLATHHVQTIVLDECDALLDYKAHRDPTHAVLTSIRRQRQNALQAVLCSATATDLLQHKTSPLADRGYLRLGFVTTLADPTDALVTPAGTATMTRVSRTVLHGVVHVPHRKRSLDMIRRILHTSPMPQQILIFVANARRVTIVVEKLADMGILAAPLHGTGDKEERAEVNRALREGTVGIVVATEMAARGLDAPLLTHVINMDLPTDASHAAHRAGRCGRGGRPGVVLHLTTSPQERNVPHKLARSLGVEMHTVSVRDGKLQVVDPASIVLDA